MKNFDILVEQWKSLLVRSGRFYDESWNKANNVFYRHDLPGGCPLGDHQCVDINNDIEAFVQGKGGGTGWDNYIEFRPNSRKSKAARIAAKRSLVQNVPDMWFARSINTRFGWELIQWIDESMIAKEVEGVILRPRLTKYGCLSTQYFEEWAVEVTGHKICLSGPRQEAFLRIVLGEDWRSLFPIK